MMVQAVWAEVAPSGASQTETSLGHTTEPAEESPAANTSWPRECSADARVARRQQIEDCTYRREELGLQDSITDDEMVPDFSCPAVESNTEFFAGCKDLVVDLALEIPRLIGMLFGVGRYEQEILQTCGERPEQEIGLTRQAGRHGISSLTPEQRQRLEQNRQAISAYNTCADVVREELDENQRQLRVTLSRIRQECSDENPLEVTPGQMFLAMMGSQGGGVGSGFNAINQLGGQDRDAAVSQCMRDRVEAQDCTDCVQVLSRVPFPEAMLRSIYNDIRSYGAFQCFDKRTQGYMVCEVASLALGSGLVLRAGSRVGRALGQGVLERTVNRSRSSTVTPEAADDVVPLVARSGDQIPIGDTRQIRLNPANCESPHCFDTITFSPETIGHIGEHAIDSEGLQNIESALADARAMMSTTLAGASNTSIRNTLKSFFNSRPPFRPGKFTSFFPENTDIDELVSAIPNARLVERPTNHPDSINYSFDHEGARYVLAICNIDICTDGARQVPRGGVMTLYPDCGSGVRRLVRPTDVFQFLRDGASATVNDVLVDYPCAG